MEAILITPIRAVVLKAMVGRPKQPRYVQAFAEELGIPKPTLRNLLYRFEEAGWMVSTVAERTRYSARRNFRLTPAGLRMARAELKAWEFTDARS